MAIFLVLVTVIIINIVFGYWRASTRRYSWRWILAIHIPIPVAILLRLWLLGWNWVQLPLFVAGFAAGQFAGGIIRLLMLKKSKSLGSFLIADLGKLWLSRHRKEI
jgi:hypothetical protein